MIHRRADAAKYLGISVDLLDDEVKKGNIPYAEITGAVKVFRQADLDEYVAARIKRATDDAEVTT